MTPRYTTEEREHCVTITSRGKTSTLINTEEWEALKLKLPHYRRFEIQRAAAAWFKVFGKDER